MEPFFTSIGCPLRGVKEIEDEQKTACSVRLGLTLVTEHGRNLEVRVQILKPPCLVSKL